MTVNTETRTTPIYNRHVKLGAKMVDFHSWMMPMQYKGIVAEHLSVRSSVGIFDVSHMGTIDIKGTDAYSFVQYLIPNNLDKIEPGAALYSALCNEQGFMIDDLIVYMFSKQHILLVVNATTVENDFEWIIKHRGRFAVEINNISNNTALIALQGPKACGIMEKLLDQDLSVLKKFHFGEFKISGINIIVARTGYTGEDGFELFVDADKGEWLWDKLMDFKPEPIGLGARDTLRLEKGYILYGSDADDKTTPIEAGIKWTVDLNKNDFIGKKALSEKRPSKKLVRIEMIDNGIPRSGFPILCNGDKIGIVTSGTFSPSLQKGIAMGHINMDSDCKDLQIEIRGRLLKAVIK